jgi:hypothetical protein
LNVSISVRIYSALITAAYGILKKEAPRHETTNTKASVQLYKALGSSDREELLMQEHHEPMGPGGHLTDAKITSAIHYLDPDASGKRTGHHAGEILWPFLIV